MAASGWIGTTHMQFYTLCIHTKTLH